mmetsp:Transcript_33003/g.82967  ORF Transcript_33003/g.82967 Transcript_33003/m.82967 type:complete len:307 (-) Transcript_33003:2439-3359(-)
MCSNDNNRGALRTGCHAVKPELDARFLLARCHVPHHDVDRALRQEELVGGVVQLLPREVPRAQRHRDFVGLRCEFHGQQERVNVNAVRRDGVCDVRALKVVLRRHALDVVLAAGGVGGLLLGGRLGGGLQRALETAQQGCLAHILLAHHHELHAVARRRALQDGAQELHHGTLSVHHHLARRRLQVVALVLEVVQLGEVPDHAGDVDDLVVADIQRTKRGQLAHARRQRVQRVVLQLQHHQPRELADVHVQLLDAVVVQVQLLQVGEVVHLGGHNGELVVRHVQHAQRAQVTHKAGQRAQAQARQV